MPTETRWTVYLSGEIHSPWRAAIDEGCRQANLAVRLTSPNIDHASSDDCGVEILGSETDSFWKDHKAAGLNAIRTRTLIREADIVVVRFGSKYRQWNAAFDAGFAHALGKPLITLHDTELNHALKEIDAAACATAQSAEQVVKVLTYVTRPPGQPC